jgi:hypothetical protein
VERSGDREKERKGERASGLYWARRGLSVSLHEMGDEDL